MSESGTRPLFSTRSVFAAAAILALGFALATGHIWEDYLITYKASRNLATGHGFVFHAGERVHTYTSPLGTLLPALCCLITLNRSDEAALWIFRVMSILAFAGGAALVFRTVCHLRWRPLAAAAAVVWMITDAKSVDFSTNGMETGLLLFFVSYALWSLFACEQRRWLHLGLSWAGLMWTRPDGCVYIAAMATAILIFNDRARSGLGRLEWLKLMGRAALVCAAVYLPWFIFAWTYYGSPVPNTLIAKATAAGPKPLSGALWTLLKLPFSCWTGISSVDGTFMPSNFTLGGWPQATLFICRAVASIAALLWALPFLRWEGRVASFIYFLMMAYLGYFPGYPASWYLPGPAWLALFAIGSAMGTWAQSTERARLPWRSLPATAAALFAIFAGWLTFEVARESVVQQTIVDGGNRRTIGLWLKEHATPGESVFMECLGYFGYYSELKTYDYPGLSSREVVQAAREVGLDWHRLIEKLHPDWLALRPWEALQVAAGNPALLGGTYELVHHFDVTDQASAARIFGHGLISFDSQFFVFHRRAP